MTTVALIFAAAMLLVLAMHLLVSLDQWLDRREQQSDRQAVRCWCIPCQRYLGDDRAADIHLRLAHQRREQSTWDALP